MAGGCWQPRRPKLIVAQRTLWPWGNGARPHARRVAAAAVASLLGPHLLEQFTGTPFRAQADIGCVFLGLLCIDLCGNSPIADVLNLIDTGFSELDHYYRPAGLPREKQPWLASAWRR
jgi:hypothetical protein